MLRVWSKFKVVEMAEIITKADIIKTPQPNALTLPQNGLNVGNDLKEFKEFADTIKDILKEFNQLRGIMPTPTAQKPNNDFEGSSGVNPTINQTNEVRTMKQPIFLEVEEVKGLLKNLLVVQAEKLPSQIKEKKIDEIVGANFEKFEYNHMGLLTIDAERILNIISAQTTEVLNEIIKKKSG